MAKSTSKLFQSEEPTEMKEDALNLPEEDAKEETLSDTPLHTLVKQSANEVTNSITNNPNDDIQDINLSSIKKKRFRINGDNSKILELNTSDLGITSRMSSSYERLMKHMDKVGKILSDLPEDIDDVDGEKEKVMEEQLKSIDAEMRKEIDYIFDAPVSDVCGYGGSMYDPFEGMFRFEHIIDAISKLYETNLNREFNMMRKRVNSKTSKYTKKYHN